MSATSKNAMYDLLIIGTGAAGLAAAKAAKRRRLSYVMVEASSRIGGRAYTKQLFAGCAVDIGCQYLHSANINPLVAIAKRSGFSLHTRASPKHCYRQQRRLPTSENADYARYIHRTQKRFTRAVSNMRDVAINELIDHSSRFAPFYKYYLSLLHSKDPDSVSVFDAVLYRETNKDYLVKEGLGTLITHYGRQLPVSLNCPVTAIDWGLTHGVCAHTPKGNIRATAAIITVSTGVLDRIRFNPPLPEDKQCAIFALPMGNYKHLYGELQNGSGISDEYKALQFAAGKELYLQVRFFGQPHIEISIAGRLADELDKKSTAAQRDFFTTACRQTLGTAVSRRLGRFTASRWRHNQWVRGAYAAARPGHGLCRNELAKPLADRLYFAGEATSQDSYNTVHGAYLSGWRAVREFAGGKQ